MSAQNVIDKKVALNNLLEQMSRLLMVIENPTVEGVDISGSDFTTRYNALKASIDVAWIAYDTATDAYTP